MVFDQSNSYFKTEQIDDSVLQRVKAGAIHPTGMMFGKGTNVATKNVQQIEQTIIDANKVLVDGLVKMELSFDRRALRVFASELSWRITHDSSLVLSFFLPAGSYATSLIRELVATDKK